MAELVGELERDPTRARRRTAAALSLVGLVALGVVGYRHAIERRSLCTGAAAHLHGIWDAARRQEVERAFSRTGKPYAADAWRTVSRLLDGYATRWTAMHTEACEATRLRGEQSELLLDARMQCLDRRLGEVQSLAALYSAADEEVLRNAVQAAEALTPLDGCSAAQALLVPAPPDPSRRARAAELRRELADVKALGEAGKYKDGIARAEPLVQKARALAYPLVEGEVLAKLGEL
jgi:hypothetical protein